LNFEEEKKRLDLFGAELKRKPNIQGYIVVYGSAEEITEEIIKRVDAAKYRFVTQYRVDVERVTVVYRQTHNNAFITELWIAPKGITLPTQ